MKGKIGVFCPTLNTFGGGEYVAIAIANALAQNNRDVTLFSSEKIDPAAIKNYFGEPLYPTIKTLVQPTDFAPRGLADFYQTIIHSYIAKNKCDAFVDAFSNCVYPWTQVAYIHYPYLNHNAFSSDFPYLSRPRFNQAGTVPQVILEKKLIDYQKHLVLANSYYTAAEIQRFSEKKTKVLYPPLSSIISEIGRQTTKTAQEDLVVTISRLDSNKLLERIPQIAAKTDRNIKFAVIGRLYNQSVLDHLQATAKKLRVSDRVMFYPNASVKQKIDLLQRAKIYLHTMIGEHFGISIAEAMALGCIPIVHDSGGMREFVPAPYRYANIEQAGEKIKAELSGWSKNNAEEMKIIASQFSYQNFMKRFIALFDAYSARSETKQLPQI